MPMGMQFYQPALNKGNIMAYIPDPTNATRPLDSDDADTAAAEFRALKGRVNAIATGEASVLDITGIGLRTVEVGAPDSAGTGYRIVRVAN